MPEPQVRILILAGPAGVGKSTLSWEVSAQLRQSGHPHVVPDSDELDRAWPLSAAERTALNQANLAAFWSNATKLGHDRLVLVGVFLHFEVDREWIVATIPGALITRVVLQASDQELAQRVQAREIGSEANEQLTRTLRQAQRFRRLNARSYDVLHTDGLSVPELARQVIERAGWSTPTASHPVSPNRLPWPTEHLAGP